MYVTRYLIAGALFLVTSHTAKGEEFNVKMGAVFEAGTDVERRAMKLAIQHVNGGDAILSPKIKLGQITRNLTKDDVYMSAMSVCEIAKIGVVALATMASCGVETSLQSVGNSLNLPVLQIGSKYCGIPRLSGNFFFSTRPDEEMLLRALSQYIFAKRITSLVICYQQGTDTTTIQRLITSFTRNKRYGITTKLMEIPTSMEKDIIDNSGVIATLHEIARPMNDDKNSAFVLFASPQMVIQFIAKSYRWNPNSSSKQNWIIANTDFRKVHVRELEGVTQSSVTVIKHSINTEDSLIRRFVNAWNNDKASECPTCQIPSVEAADIPITAYYIYDGVRHISAALTSMLNSNDWKGPTSLECGTLSVTPWSGGRNLMDIIKNTNSTGLLGPISLNKRGYQSVASYDILNKLAGPNEVFIKIRTWNSQSTGDANRKYTIPNVAVSNRTFRVATVEEPPFVFVKNAPDGTIQYSGFSIDLLDALAKRNGFNYELYQVEDRKYGAQLLNGSWNGLVGDVIKGRADLAIAAMTITAQREKVVDFTKRYMDYSVGIVMKKPEQAPSLFSFVYPFHSTVWFCILSALVLVSVVIFVLTQVSPRRLRVMSTNKNKFSVLNCFWFVYSSLMQQGGELKTITFPIRIVAGFWWFFALIVVSSYTANLAAFLTVTRMETPIRNFADLASQKIMQYGTVSDTSIFDHLLKKGEMSSDEEALHGKMSKMISKPNNKIDEAKNGFLKAENGDFAFLWDVAVIEYEIINHKTCGLMTVSDSIYDKGYGIALEHGSPFRDSLSLGILHLQESGHITKLIAKWWPSTGKCDLQGSDSSKRGSELTLQNFAGVFCVLAAGLLIACLAAGIEILFHIRKGKPYPPGENIVTRKVSELKESLPRVPSVESQPNAGEEEILVVLKKKDVMRYLAESETHKKPSYSETNFPQDSRDLWRESKCDVTNDGSVIGTLCCHKADDERKLKSPNYDDRAVLTHNFREYSNLNGCPAKTALMSRPCATKARIVH